MVFLKLREGTLSPGLNPDRVVMLSLVILFMTSCGFYFMEDMMIHDSSHDMIEDDGAVLLSKTTTMMNNHSTTTSRMIAAFYCAVITLTTVGFGDICPTASTPILGRLFIVSMAWLGLGMICGPLVSITAEWRHALLPGNSGIVTVTVVTLGVGVWVFHTMEGLEYHDALYASIITGTTIGYGDVTPSTDLGKVLVALYALLVVNVMSGVLDVSKQMLTNLCMDSNNDDINGIEAKKKDRDTGNESTELKQEEHGSKSNTPPPRSTKRRRKRPKKKTA